MAARNAVSVLPEPVGAATSVERALRISGQAAACASVGAGKVCTEPVGDSGMKARERVGEWRIDGHRLILRAE